MKKYKIAYYLNYVRLIAAIFAIYVGIERWDHPGERTRSYILFGVAAVMIFTFFMYFKLHKKKLKQQSNNQE